jgi:hypothetical protein
MMVYARALDADLGRKLAEAKAAISGVADMAFCQIHQAFRSFVHGTAPLCLSIDRR